MTRCMTWPRRVVLLALVVVLVAYPLVPVDEEASGWAYDGIAAAAVAFGWWGLARARVPRRRGWAMLLAGYSCWIVGELLYTLETQVWHLQTYPVPSDAAYLGGYGLMGFGALHFVRSRRRGHDRSACPSRSNMRLGRAICDVVRLRATGREHYATDPLVVMFRSRGCAWLWLRQPPDVFSASCLGRRSEVAVCAVRG